MSSIGRVFRVTTFGESHGTGVGCIIENVPPMLKLSNEDIQYQLDRRKPNQNSLLTARNEPDKVEIYSGVQNGVTLGTPICLIVKNLDIKPEDYKKFNNIPRPGHADFTYLAKYGVKSNSGGGRASARETIARVAAGGVAEKFLNLKYKVDIVSWVNSVGDIEIPKEIVKDLVSDSRITKKQVDLLGTYIVYNDDKSNNLILSSNQIILYNSHLNRAFLLNEEKDITNEIEFKSIDDSLNIIIFDNNIFNFCEAINIRCPHPETAIKIIKLIMLVKSQNDSIGGTVSCVIRNCPRSLGEPCFDKVEAELAKAMLSIPATKGFEIGSGFEGTKLKGSEHNDIFVNFDNTDNFTKLIDPLSNEKIKIKPFTNNSGGTLGGISTGENIYFRVAIKPVSSISKEQITTDWTGENQVLSTTGRHDPCVLPRAMPIIESMSAIILMDLSLIQQIRMNSCINNDDNSI